MCQLALVVVGVGVGAAQLVVALRAEDGPEEIVEVLAGRQLLAARQLVLALGHAHLLNGLALRPAEKRMGNVVNGRTREGTRSSLWHSPAVEHLELAER